MDAATPHQPRGMLPPGHRSHDQLISDVAAIVEMAGVADSLTVAQAILNEISSDHYLRPRKAPKGRIKQSPEDRQNKLRDKWKIDQLNLVAKNDQTMAAARNRFQEWTSSELDVLSREDLTSTEVANMLGRTLFGVKAARKRLKDGSIFNRRGDGQPWTGPELEIAARSDLSAKQAAQMTGRSVNAVYRIRTALRRDPRKYGAL